MFSGHQMRVPNCVWATILVSFLALPFQGLAGDDGIFTSNSDLQGLLTTEAELVKGLQHYIQQEEQKILKLKQIAKSYEEIQIHAQDDKETYVGNPLNSYLLIKKMTSDWTDVKEMISANPGEDFLQNITTQKEVFKWPSDQDLNGAAVALVRLQSTYKLDTDDLAHGQLNGKSYGTKLSAHDCFELGRQSYNVGDHYHSILWMNQALKRLEEEENKTVDAGDVYEYLAFSAYVQGNIRRALRLTNKLLEVQPGHTRAMGNKVYYESTLQTENDAKFKRGEDGLGEFDDPEGVAIAEESDSPGQKTPEKTNYEKLCRGENELTEAYKAKLFCQYTTGQNPYLIYQPYKEEVVHLKPKIIIYHEVLGDNEINTIKTLSTPRFKRATVQNYKTGELETANYRISKTAWLKREEHNDIERIYQRVGDITGLNMDTSEELQVSNYGMGGHYEPHFDFARREEEHAFKSLGTGNRIATWLFYESDVDQGGATVFPQLGIGLWPKKGSAVFWYNLHRNGEGDEMTRHAACPVLAGTKWVSNFWLHERGQEFIRPCTTSPFE
ncbi:prolyl 4-hydroxylase subunit alpha-1-like [Tigriopus californicus]|nr:prolyl 4-hydroxylase subunit alpha-1-like [Tigriopus californicus]XP_059084631.1 prolyl 4-hydroxylase subunit alpha-1-like [Tigriopus californicus]